jgi:replicative DNA helicase
MSALQLIQRLICSRSRLNPYRIESGMLNTADFQRLTNIASQLADAPIFIDDTPSLSIGEFKAKARRLRQRHKIEMIAVDYLQLMRSTSKRAGDNRQIEIAEISSGIKAVAKELDVPVMVLAQLNRSPEQREGGQPRLSDLRESGSIEQDADVVGLLARPQYYADNEEDREAMQGEAELILAKNRSGPTGVVKLTFLNEFMRFENRAHDGGAG